MSRPLRIQFPAPVYHVINRGAARQPTFVDDEDSQAFLDTLAEAYRLWQIEIFAYHLCLRTPKGNLSRVMRHGAWSLGSGITILQSFFRQSDTYCLRT
jgi:putative transposase